MFRNTIVTLAALALAGSAALAAGQNELTYSKDGRIVSIAHPSGKYMRAKAREPGLVKIFDNLLPAGKYPYSTYFCCYAVGIMGPNSGFFGQQWIAEGFTPTADANGERD